MTRTVTVALALLLLNASPALAKYIPTRLFDMFGSSDLILTGTIVEVRETTFVLEIDKVVAGQFEAPVIEVTQFRDWTCAARWAPYAAEQQVLLCLFNATDTEGQQKWAIRSGGGEGEMPIVEDEVYCSRGGLPTEGLRAYPMHGGEVYATKLPLPALLRTIRAFRRLYTWEFDRSTPMPRVVAVRRTGADEALAEFRASGWLATHLAEQTEACRYFKP